MPVVLPPLVLIATVPGHFQQHFVGVNCAVVPAVPPPMATVVAPVAVAVAIAQGGGRAVSAVPARAVECVSAATGVMQGSVSLVGVLHAFVSPRSAAAPVTALAASGRRAYELV